MTSNNIPYAGYSNGPPAVDGRTPSASSTGVPPRPADGTIGAEAYNQYAGVQPFPAGGEGGTTSSAGLETFAPPPPQTLVAAAKSKASLRSIMASSGVQGMLAQQQVMMFQQAAAGGRALPPGVNPLQQVEEKIAKLEKVKRCHLHPKEIKTCKNCKRYREAGVEIEALRRKRDELKASGLSLNHRGPLGQPGAQPMAAGVPQVVQKNSLGQVMQGLNRSKLYDAYQLDPVSQRIIFPGAPEYGLNTMMKDQIQRNEYYN
eukprot:g2752.t1